MQSSNGKKNHDKHAVQRGVHDAHLIQSDQQQLLSLASDFFIREAYKTLRTNVSFALAGEEGSKVVLVTSAQQSEGKSISAVNLAISYAQTERKVVIIDCDLRRPKLARLLQKSNSVGLSNVLMNPSLADSAIIPTGIENLDAITSGDIPPNPSELLGSAQMERFLAELKTKYDLIVLDTPPINMVIDAVALAPQTDGVLFVVRANQTERGAVAHAVEQLEYAKIKILGFVLNGVDLEQTSYGYGRSQYRKYRRYGYGKYGYGKYGYKSHYGYGYQSKEMHSEDENG